MKSSAKRISRKSASKKSARAAKKVSRIAAAKSKSAPQKKATIVRVKPEALILNHRENGRKLARSLLKRWHVTLPADEIDSVVDLSLCEAAARYDAKKGASFITFLFYHLRGHLVRTVATAAGDTNFFVILAKSAGLDVSDWMSSEDADADAAVIPDVMFMAQQEIDSPETLILQQERYVTCHDACASLDDLERQVIERSFIKDEPLVDIASTLGYSRCHISRVKKVALTKIREFIKNKTGEEIPLGLDEEESDERLTGIDRKVARRQRRRRFIGHQRQERVAA